MKDEKYGFQIFTLLLTAFPFWFLLFLWIGYMLIGWLVGSDTSRVYENKWGIELPSEWKEAHYVESGPSFHGDGTWYSIYENVSQDSIVELGIPFIKGKNDAVEEEVRFVTEALEIENKNQPDYTKDFVWARLSEEYGNYLIFLFFPEENRLFLAQAFF